MVGGGSLAQHPGPLVVGTLFILTGQWFLFDGSWINPVTKYVFYGGIALVAAFLFKVGPLQRLHTPLALGLIPLVVLLPVLVSLLMEITIRLIVEPEQW